MDYMYPPVPPRRQAQPVKKKKEFWVRYKLPILLAAVLLLAASPSVYFFAKYNSMTSILKLEGLTPEKEAAVLVERIGKKMLLPAGEEPTVANVSNANKLGGQVFFAEAENGDKVLVFAEAKKVVLYRPAIDRIINISSLNVSTDLTEESSE